MMVCTTGTELYITFPILMQGAEASDMLLVWHLRVINQVRGCMPSFRSSLSNLGVYLVERRSVRLVQVFFSEGAWEKGRVCFSLFSLFLSQPQQQPRLVFQHLRIFPCFQHLRVFPRFQHLRVFPRLASSRFPPLPAPSRFPPRPMPQTLTWSS